MTRILYHLVCCPYRNGSAWRVRRGSFTVWSNRKSLSPKTLNSLKPWARKRQIAKDTSAYGGRPAASAAPAAPAAAAAGAEGPAAAPARLLLYYTTLYYTTLHYTVPYYNYTILKLQAPRSRIPPRPGGPGGPAPRPGTSTTPRRLAATFNKL